MDTPPSSFVCFSEGYVFSLVGMIPVMESSSADVGDIWEEEKKTCTDYGDRCGCSWPPDPRIFATLPRKSNQEIASMLMAARVMSYPEKAVIQPPRHNDIEPMDHVPGGHEQSR